MITMLIGLYLLAGLAAGLVALQLRRGLLHHPVPAASFPAPIRLLLAETGREHARFVAVSLVAWPYVGVQATRVGRALTRPRP